MNDFISQTLESVVNKNNYDDVEKYIDGDFISINNELIGYTGTEEYVVLPQYITSIQQKAFNNNDKVKSLVIPDTTKKIAKFAFCDCTSLKNVYFPANIEKVDAYAFYNCDNLENLYINKVEYIDENLLVNRGEWVPVSTDNNGLWIACGILLKSDQAKHNGEEDKYALRVPKEVKKISRSALDFGTNLGLEEFTFTNSIEKLNHTDFNFYFIKKITISDSVTGSIIVTTDSFVDEDNFISQSNLFEEFCELYNNRDFDTLIRKFGEDLSNTIKSDETTTTIIHEAEEIKNEQTALFGASSSKVEEIKNEFLALSETNVSEIEKKINITDHPKEYKKYIVDELTNDCLSKVFVFAEQHHSYKCSRKVIASGGKINTRLSKTTDYYVIDNILSAAKIISFLRQIENGNSIEIVLLNDLLSLVENEEKIELEIAKKKKETAIHLSKNLPEPIEIHEKSYTCDDAGCLLSYYGEDKHIILPRGIKAIGQRAFSYSRIASIIIQEGVEEIKEEAFLACNDLVAITVPPTLKRIGVCAFGASAITSIVIPEGVEELGEHAFEGCDYLASINLPSTLKRISGSTFAYSGITSVVISEGVSELDEAAFIDCTRLKSISLPTTIKTMKSYAFENCTSLEAIAISEGVEEIGKKTFLDCKNLKSITLPSTLKIIGKKAFSGVSSLESIIIPEGVEEIKEEAFLACKNLKSITLPSTLRIIGEEAFSYCESLVRLGVPEGVEELGESSFAFCKNLEYVSLPSTLKKASESTFWGCEGIFDVVVPTVIAEVGKLAFSSCTYIVFNENEDSKNEESDAKLNGANKINNAATKTPSSKEYVYKESENEHPLPTNQKSGCYIATAVYGSYDAPQVLTLRRYRDDVLLKSFWGREFVNLYYLLSPSIASKLKKAKHVNRLARKILDKIVTKISDS